MTEESNAQSNVGADNTHSLRAELMGMYRGFPMSMSVDLNSLDRTNALALSSPFSTLPRVYFFEDGVEIASMEYSNQGDNVASPDKWVGNVRGKTFESLATGTCAPRGVAEEKARLGLKIGNLPEELKGENLSEVQKAEKALYRELTNEEKIAAKLAREPRTNLYEGLFAWVKAINPKAETIKAPRETKKDAIARADNTEAKLLDAFKSLQITAKRIGLTEEVIAACLDIGQLNAAINAFFNPPA